MKEENEYYHKILGLRAVATQAEIKAAYHSLAKLYHPDHDQSPDAEIMYKEIRVAYDKLMNCGYHREIKTDIKTKTGSKVNSSEKRKTSETTSGRRSSFGPKWSTEYWENLETEDKYSNDRIPFEMKQLRYIFRRSLMELL